jgi:hypothetical protein
MPRILPYRNSDRIASFRQCHSIVLPQTGARSLRILPVRLAVLDAQSLYRIAALALVVFCGGDRKARVVGEGFRVV